VPDSSGISDPPVDLVVVRLAASAAAGAVPIRE
jgi:hypothetical protein